MKLNASSECALALGTGKALLSWGKTSRRLWFGLICWNMLNIILKLLKSEVHGPMICKLPTVQKPGAICLWDAKPGLASAVTNNHKNGWLNFGPDQSPFFDVIIYKFWSFAFCRHLLSKMGLKLRWSVLTSGQIANQLLVWSAVQIWMMVNIPLNCFELVGFISYLGKL